MLSKGRVARERKRESMESVLLARFDIYIYIYIYIYCVCVCVCFV